MSTRVAKAKIWKRALVLLGAGMCLGSGVLMGFVPNGDTFFRQYGKWALCALLTVGGLWLVVIAVRGDRRQTDKTLDQMSGGLMGGL
jgi:hypothetical protein